jgi:hypothetical protein
MESTEPLSTFGTTMLRARVIEIGQQRPKAKDRAIDDPLPIVGLRTTL